MKHMTHWIFPGLPDLHVEKALVLEIAKPHQILDIVCLATTYTPTQMKGRNRRRELVYARHIFSVLCRQFTDLSYQSIGDVLHRHHATILNGCRKHPNMLKYDDYSEVYYKCFDRVVEYSDSLRKQKEKIYEVYQNRLK